MQTCTINFSPHMWNIDPDSRSVKKNTGHGDEVFQSILHILHKDHVTNNEVMHRIETVTGPHEDLLTTVKKCKMRSYGHVSWSKSLVKTILQGTMPGSRRRGRQHKRWEDNIKEWTGLSFAESQIAAKDRMKWQTVIIKSLVSQQPSIGWWDDDDDDDDVQYCGV